MPHDGQIGHDQARDHLLAILNRKQHWVLVCVGAGGRWIAEQVRQRYYADSEGDFEALALPGAWLGGQGALPLAISARSRMTAADLAMVTGEFSKRRVLASDLEPRRIIVVGDAPPERARDVLFSLDRWLRDRKDFQRVGMD